MIGLIDCNNFYCSCERLFDPSLIGKPLIVLSNNDGCAISRSEEAKALGINMGTPAFMIESLIRQHAVQVRSSNYTLYGDISDRVMTVVKSYISKVEVYSIDEIFVDFSGVQPGDMRRLVADIKTAIETWIGIPVCIGVGPTKTLAKMANRFAKKQCHCTGYYIAATEAEINTMLQRTTVGNIWGIGRQHQKFLVENGFETAADFAQAPAAWVRSNFSVVGARLQAELKGTSCIKWEEAPPPKKLIRTSRSFNTVISEKRPIEQAIAAHTTNCSRILRKEGSCAKKMEVFIQTNAHRGSDRQYYGAITVRLPVATSNAAELVKHALKGLSAIFKPGYQYQKAGVTIVEVIKEDQVQLGLFDTVNRKATAQAMKSMDDVNRWYGKDVVRTATQAYSRRWKLKAERLSPRYTTQLNDIPKAKACLRRLPL